MSELQGRANTSPGGHPFDFYDNRIGNLGPPDGAQFRGRGFLQITGRANYAKYGSEIGLGNMLVKNPALANDPAISAKILAAFLKSREIGISQALAADDLGAVLRIVNGGTAGLESFTEAYQTGSALIT